MLSCLNSGCTFPECNPPPFCEPSWAPPTEATCPPSTSRWTCFLSFVLLFNLYTFLLNSNWMSITLSSATTSAIAFSPWWKKLPIFSLVLHNKRYDAYCFTLFFLENLLNLYLVSLVPWPFMLSCCFLLLSGRAVVPVLWPGNTREVSHPREWEMSLPDQGQ